MMLTDVMKEASDLLFVGNAASEQGFEKAFGGKIIDSAIYRKKILSGKLQIVPPLDGAFKKMNTSQKIIYGRKGGSN